MPTIHSGGTLPAAAGAGLVLFASVVAGGARTDIVMSTLDGVRAPTLLIASDADPLVLALNRIALDRLKSYGQIAVITASAVPADSAAASEQMAQLAAEWFAARPPVVSRARSAAAG